MQTFNTDQLNQITTVTRAGTLTVAGTSGEKRGDETYGYPHGVTNVTVSGTGLSSGLAQIYADGSWARTNASPATSGASTYTAIALDTYGRTDTNSVNVTLPGSLSFQYDLNGNLTNDGSRAFEYDAENQLTNVFVASSWRTSFAFDAFGRMRIHREYNWQSSAWVLANEVRYVYDGMLVIQERDGSNLPQVSYTRGNDLSGSLQGAGGIGGLLARTDMGLQAIGDGRAHALYHADGNGNITCLMQTNGLVVARYSYEPFGRVLTMSGSLAEVNAYRFSSKEWHDRTGLYYYGFRFYEPGLQRWLNRDPIGEEGGVNLFVFVVNSPVRWVDPFGQDLFSDPINPASGSDNPLGDFAKKCAESYWDEYKGGLEDWAMNGLFDGKIGLCYDNLRDCVKDNTGLTFPELGNKGENLGGSGSGKGKGKGWKLGIGLNGLGLGYMFNPNIELRARVKFGNGSKQCEGGVSFNF